MDEEKLKRTKPDLRIYWSKRESALVYDGSNPTGGLLATMLEGVPYELDHKTLAKELEARGYDLSTLRFSIRLLARKTGGE
jgi:hypothetical protein